MNEQFKWQDALALLGLGVAAWPDMPVWLRCISLLLSAIALPASFFTHRDWSRKAQWGWSTLAVFVLGFMAYKLLTLPEPKTIKSVDLSWASPNPILASTPLSDVQLNAHATYNGEPVPGDYVYDPANGSTLPPGVQTLRVTFSPIDLTSFSSRQMNVTVLVNDDAKKGGGPKFRLDKGPISVRAMTQTKELFVYQQMRVTNDGSGPGSVVSMELTLKVGKRTLHSLPIAAPNVDTRVRIDYDNAMKGWNVLPGRMYWTHAVRDVPVQLNEPKIAWTFADFSGVGVKDLLKAGSVLTLTCGDSKGRTITFSTPTSGAGWHSSKAAGKSFATPLVP